MENITNNPVYKQVLADSFGGIMYNVANQGKYDTTEIMAIWNGLSDPERGSANGIIKGAINFMKEGTK